MIVLSLEDPAVAGAIAGAGWALLSVGLSVLVNFLGWGRRQSRQMEDRLAVSEKRATERAGALGQVLDAWQQQVVRSVGATEDGLQAMMEEALGAQREEQALAIKAVEAGMVQLNQNQQMLMDQVQETRAANSSLSQAVTPLLQEDRLIDPAGWRRQVEQGLLEAIARIDKQAKILQEMAQLQQQVLDPRTDSLAELTGRLESVQQEFMARQAARNGGLGGANQPRRS